MIQKKIRGLYTTIITPFLENSEIDWDSLDKIIELQITNRVTGVVPCGTTGESPTLTDAEQEKLIRHVVTLVDKRCQVIAGTGTNCTAKSIEKSKKAVALGADACMLVNPYYNKPTQNGLYLHFRAIADAVDVPIVLYNIRGRTSVNLETSTLLKLIQDCENICAVKEASGDLKQMKEVIDATPDSFSVLSGDDGLAYDLIKLGGDGLISVASNVIPSRVRELVEIALSGNFEKAQEIHQALLPFFEGEFIETNPIPIKYAAWKAGLCKEVYRLPMCGLGDESRKKWDNIVREYL